MKGFRRRLKEEKRLGYDEAKNLVKLQKTRNIKQK